MKQTFLTLLLALLLGLPGIEAFAHDGSVKVNGTEFFFNIVNGAAEITYKGDRPNQYTDRYTGSIAIPKQVSYKSKTYPVTSIGVSAFDYCSGLTSITIPNSVTNIGDYAFRKCSGLTSVTVLAETLPTLSSTAFVNINLGNITLNVLRCLYNEYKSSAPWNQFTNIKARHDVAVANVDSKTIFYNYVNNKTALEVTYQGSAPDEYDEYTGSLVIPSSVTYNGNDYPVTGIGSAAFSGCSGLTKLDCHNCRLTSLDVSGCTALLYLVCDDNNLATLDVSKNTALTFLGCSSNQLTALNLSNNTNLQSLDCRNNKLTSLDVSNLKDNTVLNMLWCSGNNIRGEGMATLVNSLPKVTSGQFVVYDTDGTDGNRITTVQVAAAKAKGWSVLTRSLEDYPGVAPGIAIDATNFPDGNFRTYVSSNCDTDKDTYLSDEEIAAVTEIDVDYKSISDLKGIEYFTALAVLYCYVNQLASLDVSKNTALTQLYCGSNKLTSLDVSNNTALTYLYCDNNQLTSLDVSKNTALTELRCYNNQLTSLDVSKNTALRVLYCYDNQLTSLDVSKNTALKELRCGSNQLTSLDVSKNTALTYLYCYNNQLTSLDVSKNTALIRLECNNNKLTTLDVSKNAALEYLYCYYNQLTSLDVSKNTALECLYCYYNQLTSLDVSKNTALTELGCYNNQLTSLDVSDCTALAYLSCYGNQIRGAGMATLIENLPTVTGGNFFVYNTDGTDGNRITTVQVAAAKAKGWNVQTSSGSDYPGVDLDIAIDEDNFPDDRFRNWLLALSLGADSKLSPSEIAEMTVMDVSGKGITSLTGIEHFTALTTLHCNDNRINYLNLKENTELTEVWCYNNLIRGYAMKSFVENLPSSGGVIRAVSNSETEGNAMTSLQVQAANAKGWTVQTDNGSAYAGIDPGIAVNSTNFPNDALREQVARYVDEDGDGYINSVEILNKTSFDLSRRNIDNIMGLQYLTSLTSLDLSCNLLDGAMVRFLPKTSGGELRYMNVYSMIHTYPQIEYNKTMTPAQVQEANAKGWTVMIMKSDGSGWVPYNGEIIPGDANGDGEVNAQDVDCLRDYILGLDPTPFSLESANLNGDSAVNIADLAKLIQLLTE